MMNRFWWWALGAGTLLWGLKAMAAAPKKLGELTLSITFSPLNAGSVNAVLSAILSAKTSCPGLPPIKTLLGTPEVTGTAVSVTGKTQPSATVRAVFAAEWSHDTLGPIKEEARQCLLRYLQGIEPKIVSIAAIRTT